MTAATSGEDKLGPLNESVRSTYSTRSDGSSKSSSQRIDNLSSHLLRTQSNRDPLEIYEIMEILGEGSMGSVSRVSKKLDAIGGSARPGFVQKHGHKNCCFGLLGNAFFAQIFPTRQDAFLDSSRSSSIASSTIASSNGKATTASAASGGPRKRLYRKQSSIVKHSEDHKAGVYALKSIHLDRCTTKEYVDELKNEIAILKNIDHPNIVRAIETYNFKDRMYMVLELCSGGDLYTREPYTEMAVQSIAKSLFSAMAYLHSRGITHRDLKFENIMFASPQSDVVKIIDFGLSQKFASNEVLHDQVGTVYTMAPELLAGDYNEKADIWSLGVITFMLLSSSMPFYGRDRVHVIKRIIQGRYHFKARRWASVSQEAQDFVSSCLINDPNKRPSGTEAQNNPWLRGRRRLVGSVGANGEEDLYGMLDKIQATMASFASYSKLKQLALMVVAYKSTTEEIGHLREIFNMFDIKQNGEISLDEFKDMYQAHYDYSDEELQDLFSGIDLDGTGVVHYIEFLAATLESHGSIDEDRLAEAFDRLDSDDSGWITVENLRDFLGEDVPLSYLNEVIDECDIEEDHRISYDEFISLWNEDDDVKYKENCKRALSRHSSKMSATSSFDDRSDDLTYSSRTQDSQDNSSGGEIVPGAGVTGTGMFKERKHLSVRGQWV